MEKYLASRISLLGSWFRYPTEILSFLAYYMYVLMYRFIRICVNTCLVYTSWSMYKEKMQKKNVTFKDIF